jgi:Holliday junction resolvase RusA-like endonuclease
MLIYTIPGDPSPLARARISGRRVYDAQADLKTYLKLFLTNQHKDRPFYTGPQHLHATFYMGMPKSAAKHIAGKPHKYRPDLDNLLKMVCDISTGILYDDDCCIAMITCNKVYDYEARTEFYLEQLEDHGKAKIKGE